METTTATYVTLKTQFEIFDDFTQREDNNKKAFKSRIYQKSMIAKLCNIVWWGTSQNLQILHCLLVCLVSVTSARLSDLLNLCIGSCSWLFLSYLGRAILYSTSLHCVCTVVIDWESTRLWQQWRFLYLNHLSKEFLEQMIPHLKALI